MKLEWPIRRSKKSPPRIRWVGLAHFIPVLLIYTPENIKKPKGFLTFSGVIDKQHCDVMG